MSTDVSRGGAANRSPSIAVFLSFLWPGLGQWYAGRRRSALIYALPVVLVAVAVVAQARNGIVELALQLFTPALALNALILAGVTGIWRLLSMLDAMTAAGGRRAWRRSRVGPVFGLLAAVVVFTHAAIGFNAWTLYQAGSEIFVGSGQNGQSPAPGASADPGQILDATPQATPVSPTARVNILLTGIDSSRTRAHALNDTLIVVSIDPATRQVAMLSFPRDLSQLPLWDGRTYAGKINSLMTYARAHPAEFPDGGLPTLIRELGYLAGVPIHYYAAVDLGGFVKMVDLVGGIDVVNNRQIADPGYGGWTNGHPIGFFLSAGRHHLDGQAALAYARSRKGPGDNDFTRSRRQQEILVALGKKLADPAMLTKVPDLIRAAGDTIRTNFPPDRLGEMLQIGQGVTGDSIKSYVLGPPYATYPAVSTGTYELIPDMSRFGKLSIQLFGSDSRYAAAGAQASPAP